jgi:hypothetical protein
MVKKNGAETTKVPPSATKKSRARITKGGEGQKEKVNKND